METIEGEQVRPVAKFLEEEKSQLPTLETNMASESAENKERLEVNEASEIDVNHDDDGDYYSETQQQAPLPSTLPRPPQQASPEAAEKISRDEISLQGVPGVEGIRHAMAEADKSKARRKRQGSETTENWQKEFEGRLEKKDKLEFQSIEQLRLQADNDKRERYLCWNREVAERRENYFREQEEASDLVDEDVWTKMRRLVRSLSTRKNSQDLNRMRALLHSLDTPPRNNCASRTK